jgi:hypothetical protein
LVRAEGFALARTAGFPFRTGLARALALRFGAAGFALPAAFALDAPCFALDAGVGRAVATASATFRGPEIRPVVHHSANACESPNIVASVGSEARLYARRTISFAGKVRSRCVTSSTDSAPATNSGR